MSLKTYWLIGVGSGFDVYNHALTFKGNHQPPFSPCQRATQTVLGDIFSGGGQDGSGDVKPYKFNNKLNLVPGWPNYAGWETGVNVITSIRGSDDGQFVYVAGSFSPGGGGRYWKLRADNGNLIWTGDNDNSPVLDVGVFPNGDMVASSGYYNAGWGFNNAEIWSGVDGSLVLRYTFQFSCSAIQMIIAPDLNMWFQCAAGTPPFIKCVQAYSMTADTGWEWTPYPWINRALGIMLKDGALWVATDRGDFGGVNKSVFKLNPMTGALLDSFDTGFAATAIFEDYKGRIVLSRSWDPVQPLWYVYDSAMNFLFSRPRGGAGMEARLDGPAFGPLMIFGSPSMDRRTWLRNQTGMRAQT